MSKGISTSKPNLNNNDEKVSNNIPNRRDLKRNVISLQTMLRAKEITTEERMELSKQLSKVRGELYTPSNRNEATTQKLHDGDISKDEILSRRQFLQHNPGLKDTFRAIWMVFYPYTENGILTKDGYLKFQQVLNVALISSEKSLLEEIAVNLDNEYMHDTSVFGSLSEEVFYDLLFETIETWSEILDPHYYAAFAWALLDSIANTSEHPPRIRPLREIKCVTKIENEASMIKHYLSGKKVRAALAIEAEWLSRVPDVQKRLHARKKGADLNQAQQEMVNALSISMGLHRQDLSGANDHNDSDSEDQSVNSFEKPIDPPLIEQIVPEIPQSDTILNSGSLDGDSCSTASSQSGDFVVSNKPLQRRGNYLMHANTQSFMNYIQARRSSKIIMNGGYTFNTSITTKLGASVPSLFEGPFEESNEDHNQQEQKRQNFSFSQFVASGKSLNEYKNEHQRDDRIPNEKKAFLNRKISSKFDIDGNVPLDNSDDYSESSSFSFFGNKDANLAITATGISPESHRKKRGGKDIRKDNVNSMLLNSSYLLKIESPVDNGPRNNEKARSHTVDRRSILSVGNQDNGHMNSQMFQKNLIDTAKYGFGKRTDTVVLDAKLFAERLTNVIQSRNVDGPSDISTVSGKTKKSGLVFSDEESSNNTESAVRTFPNSSHVEPSHGKAFHDPLNPKLVEAFFAAHEIKESALRESYQRQKVNQVSAIEAPPESPTESPSTTLNGDVPNRNRFLTLIDRDSPTRPLSPELALGYSKSAWDVNRALHGVKMESDKKMKLLETMQQATAASLMENSSHSSLVTVQSVKRIYPTPEVRGKQSLSGKSSPVVVDEISPSVSQILTLDDEIIVDEKLQLESPEIVLYDRSPAVGEASRASFGDILTSGNDTNAPFLGAPISYSDSVDLSINDSPHKHDQRQRSFLSVHSSGGTSRSDEESWSGSVPSLLDHPSQAVPPPIKSRLQATRSSKKQSHTDSITLNMESMAESSKVWNQTNSQESIMQVNRMKPIGSHVKKISVSPTLPELFIKQMSELPRMRKTKSRVTTTPKSPTGPLHMVGGIDASPTQSQYMNSSPPPRTNSPSPIRRLQKPTSPVLSKEAKSMVFVQGSLATSASFSPNHVYFPESNSRFFASVDSCPSAKTLTHQKVPWLPRGTLTPLDHDRSDLIEGWREKLELLRYQPFDTSKIPMTIKSQTAVKHAFEQYVKSLSYQPNQLSPIK